MLKIQRPEKANTEDPDETAHYEPSHLNLQCCKFSYCCVLHFKGLTFYSFISVLGPKEADITKQPWFIGVVIGSVSGMLWLVFCILTVWLCRKRKQKKIKEPWFTGTHER